MPKVAKSVVLRYADDFVILHNDLNILMECKRIIEDWLKDMELESSKTRIVHTLECYEQTRPGLDFLGFEIRQYKVGKYQSGKAADGKQLGFKTIIKPSRNTTEPLQRYWKNKKQYLNV